MTEAKKLFRGHAYLFHAGFGTTGTIDDSTRENTVMNRFVMLTAAATMATAIAAPAHADDHAGEELRGQTVDMVFADGTRNSVFFGSTGVATISNSTGQSANANWFMQGNKLCMRASSATECWNYSGRFSAGQAVRMTSSCNGTSTWTARGVNPAREVVAPIMGERG